MVFDSYKVLRGSTIAFLCLFAIFISRKITMKDKMTLQKFFFNRYFILTMLFYAIIYMITNLVLFTIGTIVNTCMFQHMIMIGISEEMKKG
jgi:hypothetical protein